MNNQKFRDMRDGAVGFAAAIALGASCLVILLGALGFFDQGVKYKYPPCHPGTIEATFTSCDQRAAREYRR